MKIIAARRAILTEVFIFDDKEKRIHQHDLFLALLLDHLPIIAGILTY